MNTILRYASRRGYRRMTEMVLKCGGASVNDEDVCTGETSLHLSIKKGNRSVVEVLLNYHCAVYYTDVRLAIELGEIDILRLLASRVPPFVNWGDSNGESPLFWAIDADQLAVVSFLLDRGANVYAVSGFAGDDALSRAVAKASVHVVQRLLLQCGSPNILNRAVHPLLHLATRRGAADIVTVLLDFGGTAMLTNTDECGSTALHCSISPVVSALLLRHNEDLIQAIDKSGRTALHYAASKGNVDVVRVLLQSRGVVVNARDRQGETPFHVAIENGHLQTGGVADVLLQHHADINAQDSLGYTSLLQAAHGGDINAVVYLLSRGARINLPSFTGKTALKLAVEASRYRRKRGAVEVVRVLKSHGAILHSPAGYVYEHDTSSVMGSTGSDIDASMQGLGLGAEPQGVSRGAPMFRFVAGLGSMQYTTDDEDTDDDEDDNDNGDE